MRYRIGQLKIDPRTLAGENLEKLLLAAVGREIRRKARIREPEIGSLEIIRESIDARKKPDVKLVYTVDFDCADALPFEEAGRREYCIPEAVGSCGSPVSYCVYF